MREKRDYTDFLEYALNNLNFSRTKIIDEYRKNGGKIRKKKGLELLRDLTGVEKGESKKSNLGKIINEKTKKPKDFKNKDVATVYEKYFGRKNNYFKPTRKDYYSKKNQMVLALMDNIESYTGIIANEYLKVDVQIVGDSFTQNTKFGIFVDKNIRGVKRLGTEVLNNIYTYVSGVLATYGIVDKYQTEIFPHRLDPLKKELKKAKRLDFETLQNLFERYGVTIGDIQRVVFTD